LIIAAHDFTEAEGAALIQAVGPSQYAHAELCELIDLWAAKGKNPRAQTIRRECARAALQQTGENFAQIGRRIFCTKAAISAGVIDFCKAHKIPNRAGRGDVNSQRCRAARLRVLRGERVSTTPEKRDALAGILAALRGASRRWIAQQCGVSIVAAWSWFARPGSSIYRRPIRYADTLAKLAKSAQYHPMRKGRHCEK
jgi:hypothetical protein